MKKLLPTLTFSLLAALSVSTYVSAEESIISVDSYPDIKFNKLPDNFFKYEKERMNQIADNNNSIVASLKKSIFLSKISQICLDREKMVHQASIADTIVANRASGEEIDITPDMLAPQHFIDQMLSYSDNTLIEFSNKQKIEILEDINYMTHLQLLLNQSPMENPC